MVYLDNGATTFPKPVTVSIAVTDAVEHFGGNPGRSGHRLSMRVMEEVFTTRVLAAGLFGVSPENIIFTSNCTDSLNKAILGIVRPGDTVLTTTLEHNAVWRPLKQLEKQQGITIRCLPIRERTQDTLTELDRLADGVRVAVLTHCSNVFGTIVPVKEIAARLKEKGTVVICDTACTAGVLDMRALAGQVDVICAPGHKALYGPTGTGLLVRCSDVDIRPVFSGGTGMDSANPYSPDTYPERLECGTLNTVGILGLREGIRFVSGFKPGEIYDREFALIRRAYKGLAQLPGVILPTPVPEPGKQAGILSFQVKNVPSEEVCAQLNRAGYALRGGLHCAPAAHRFMGTMQDGTARISVGVFNKPKHIDGLVREVARIAG